MQIGVASVPLLPLMMRNRKPVSKAIRGLVLDKSVADGREKCKIHLVGTFMQAEWYEMHGVFRHENIYLNE